MGGLGAGDFSVFKNEGTGHLQAVTSEVPYSATFENGDHPAPPDLWAEELDEAPLTEAEGAVEFTARIGDARDIRVFAKVSDFLAGFQHVDEDKGRVLLFRLLLQILKSA